MFKHEKLSRLLKHITFSYFLLLIHIVAAVFSLCLQNCSNTPTTVKIWLIVVASNYMIKHYCCLRPHLHSVTSSILDGLNSYEISKNKNNLKKCIQDAFKMDWNPVVQSASRGGEVEKVSINLSLKVAYSVIMSVEISTQFDFLYTSMVCVLCPCDKLKLKHCNYTELTHLCLIDATRKSGSSVFYMCNQIKGALSCCCWSDP